MKFEMGNLKLETCRTGFSVFREPVSHTRAGAHTLPNTGSASYNLLGIIALCLLTTSCAIYAPKDRMLNAQLPEQFSIYSENVPSIGTFWWESFQSLELNQLIDEVLTNSPSIQQSWARLAQAEAVATQAGAARVPSISANANATASRDSTTFNNTHAYSLGLSAAYEVDLWGRIKSQTEAAALDRDASREQLNTAAITLSAQTANLWTGIIAQRLQTDLLRKQLEANLTSLELIELRFKKSFATALDVYQQRQTVAATEARIPPAELREQLLKNQLTALLGRTDFQALELSEEILPSIGTLPSIGIPADVLANRPDVRRAGLRLQSADWRVSVARADRLPAIRLTASADYRNVKSSDLFNDWFANLVGGVTGPIFEGGRRHAEVKRTRAVVDERLAEYRETVLTAIREVEDALISEEKQRELLFALNQNLELSRTTYREALSRYRNGLIEYPTVLTELVRFQTLEREQISANLTLLQDRIDLHRALGGGGELTIDDLQLTIGEL